MTDRAALTERRYSALPPNLPPRLIPREAAARYMGVGVSKFDALVLDGRAPKAKRIDGRVLWDVRRLDAAIDALPDDGQSDPWAEVA